MSLRAQRNFFLLAFAGVFWTLAVLRFQVAPWQWGASVSHALETDMAILSFWARSLPPGEGACGESYYRLYEQRDRVAPPENWKELSTLLLLPGMVAVLGGALGTSVGLCLHGGMPKIHPRG